MLSVEVVYYWEVQEWYVKGELEGNEKNRSWIIKVVSWILVAGTGEHWHIRTAAYFQYHDLKLVL
jgi:hypothetical protein